MDWAQWVIPLVALAVWILSNLVKNKQEDNRPPPNLSPRQQQEREARQRRAPEDVDRFLEEVRRRKTAAEQGERPTPASQSSAPPRGSKGREPGRRPTPPPLPTRRGTHDIPKELQREFRSIEEALQAVLRVYGLELPDGIDVYYKKDGKLRKLTRQEVRDRFDTASRVTPEVIAAAEVVSAPANRTQQAAPNVYRQPTSAAILNIKNLLSNCQNLATAMMLKEILEPPLSKRGRRP